jgi:ligand-binding sensor domain-containing protein/signal transduction histidine kinase
VRSLHARSLTIILAAVGLTAIPGDALDANKALTQYAHRIWGQEEGLFQPTIYSILQTRDGFLWLGTQDSLIRFDGVQFREFDASGGAFHDALIRTLSEDRSGSLWVGSVGSGLGKFDANGAFTHYGTANGLPSDSVFCIDTSEADGMWVCTNQGLVRYMNGQFRNYNTANGLPSNQVRATCVAGNTRWVAGLDYGLSMWTGTRFEAYAGNVLKPSDQPTALACAADGSVWVGTNFGLVHIRGSNSQLITTHDGLPDNAVSSLLVGKDGAVWVGTNDGITRLSENRVSVYRTRDGLSHSLVLSLYMDREGTLWAGTKDGLDQFTDGNVTPYTTNEGLLSNETGPVLEDAAGRLWVGTLGWGLNVFEGGRFRAITSRNGLADDTVLSLTVSKSGDLWVGTKRGLSRLHDGRVVATHPGSEIRSLMEDVDGTIWAGTDRGLQRLQGDHFRAASLAPFPATDSVIALAGGHTVRVFASTERGGFYAMRDRTFAQYSVDTTRAVDCFFLDHVRHTAWMGTLGGGLLRFQNGAVVHVRVKDGLYDNRIYQIVDDGRGNLWMASSKGIFRVSQQELDAFADGTIRSVLSVPFSTGQLRFECRAGVQPAACRTHDGRLWFSTTNGLVEVDPAHLTRASIPPRTAVSAVIVNGERMNAAHKLKLNSDQRNVEIRYAGLSFVSPEKVTFRYKLEGFDKEWTEAGSRREAFFTNLPPGHFHFVVYARSANGDLSGRPADLVFTVAPKLYQHTWFFPLLVLLAAAGGFATYRVRVNTMRRRFDLVLAERTRIARELHDTLLQGLSGVTMQLQALWMRMPASRDRKFLAGIIEDAGACAQEARRSLWGLRSPSTHKTNFSERLVQLCREVSEGSGVAVLFDVQPVNLQSAPEAEYQLLRIAREVVSNTLTHANADTLNVQVQIRDSHLHMAFEDNGIGFKAQTGIGLLDHFGLVGIRERAEEIGAELTVSSTPGSGARIAIDLPLSRAEGEAATRVPQ